MTEELVQPHDIEAEQAVLGALFLDPQAVWRIRTRLRPESFFKPQHQVIYAACVALAEHGKPIDPLTVRAQLERDSALARSGGVDYLAELSIVTPTAASVEHYAEIVEEHALRRRVILAADRLRRQARNLSLTPDALKAEAEREILAATTMEGGDILPLFGAGWGEFIAQTAIIANQGQVVTGVPLGFPRLDYLLQGMHPGDLLVLAARPSVGKTAMAFQVGYHAAAKGIPVLAFSLETKDQALRYRIAANASRIDSLALRQGNTAQQERDRLHRRISQIEHYPIRIDTRTPVTVSQVRNRTRLHHAKGLCQLLVIDYVQFLVRQQARTGREARNRNEQIEEATGTLKQLAMELGIPVLLLSQLSRESARQNRAPQLEDLRDSGALEQDADVVMFLHPRKKEDDETRPQDVDLIVAKNRNGPVRDVRLKWYPALTRFEEADGPGAPAAQQQSLGDVLPLPSRGPA